MFDPDCMPYDRQEKLGLCNKLKLVSSRKKDNFKEEILTQWKMQDMLHGQAVDMVEMEEGKKVNWR